MLIPFHAAGLISWVNAPDSGISKVKACSGRVLATNQTHPDRILVSRTRMPLFHLALIAHQRAGPLGGCEG